VIGFFRRLSDERYRRAMKRRRTEEIMGWICVPVLLVIAWFSWQAWDQAVADRPQLRDQLNPITPAATPRR
jgi:predicted negative regulator of RcsB-dependent stress response